jgi:frataxin-like iron-binding protein CyaY
MNIAFDTLEYSEKLKAVGFSPEQAKVQAQALRDAMVEHVATKSDVDTQGDRLEAKIETQGKELEAKIDTQGDRLEAKIETQGKELEAKIEAQGRELKAKIEAQGRELEAKIEAQGKRLEAKIDSEIALIRKDMNMLFFKLVGTISTIMVLSIGAFSKLAGLL